MPDLKALKTWTKEEINKLRDLLIEISHEIHAHPELGHQEHHAASYLAEILEKEGFAVERASAGLPTAFIAEFSAGTGADIGFLAEYDALPGLGHACGHNLIAASTLGAGIAIKRLLEAGELQGTVKVYGTPAEEGGGGKVTMVEAGLFDGLAAAISMHAGSGTNSVGGSSNAVLPLTFKFKGQPAHAAASPHKGVNALDAVIATFNGINALRQHVTPDVRIHGIITKGGAAANIVPDDCEASFLVRAVSKDGLAEVVEKVKNCAHAGALATGSRLEIVEALQYDDILVCAPLVDMMKANMEDVGLAVIEDHMGRGNYTAIATHDTSIIDAIKDLAAREGISSDSYEFQMLYGIRPWLQKSLADEGYKVRAYVPYGRDWYPYFSRRLAERPANIWFFIGSLFRR